MITSSTVREAVFAFMEWRLKKKENEPQVMNTLEKCYSSLNVSFDPNDIK